MDAAKTAELIDYLTANSLYSNLLFGVSEIAGMTTLVDGATTYIPKLYDISASAKVHPDNQHQATNTECYRHSI